VQTYIKILKKRATGCFYSKNCQQEGFSAEKAVILHINSVEDF
jgi:hypothetical protein